MNKHTFSEKKEFTSVRHLIEWAGETHGDKYAYSYRQSPAGEIVHIPFRRLRDDVRALTTELRTRGCSGKNCVLIGKFTYDWVLTYFSVMAAGGVLVPLDRDWSKEDLAATASTADAAWLFCDHDLSEKAACIEATVAINDHSIRLGGKEDARSLSTLVEAGRAKYAADPSLYADAPIDPMRMSLLVFTSGTTGKGKGVMLSQNAILCCMSDVLPYLDAGERTVGVLPLHHTYGSTIMLIAHTMLGCEIYISAGLRYVQKELKEIRPQHLVLVPLYLETFYRKIMANLREKGKEELIHRMITLSQGLLKMGIDVRPRLFAEIRAVFGGEVKMVISGGAPLNPQILHFYQAIGINVLNGYGITECAPLISVNHSRNVVDGSVGEVLHIDTVRIHDPNENGEGEIWVKGPNVMLGYYKDEEANAAAFENGYFKTGDYGKMDKNRILTITGRKKNLIILSNGKNVYPEEIENALAATPGIQDIIVYEGQSRRGISHNAIVAEIYPDMEYMEKNNVVDMEAHFKPYIDAYNQSTVPYKKIAILKVRTTEFPKNTLRKIMRFQLDTSID